MYASKCTIVSLGRKYSSLNYNLSKNIDTKNIILLCKKNCNYPAKKVFCIIKCDWVSQFFYAIKSYYNVRFFFENIFGQRQSQFVPLCSRGDVLNALRNSRDLLLCFNLTRCWRKLDVTSILLFDLVKFKNHLFMHIPILVTSYSRHPTLTSVQGRGEGGDRGIGPGREINWNT